MPKLDGPSATSLIRQFDLRTPIVSMTSASKPNEIMNYYSHRMNDILPKPFTKECFIEMLEVRSALLLVGLPMVFLLTYRAEAPYAPQKSINTACVYTCD